VWRLLLGPPIPAREAHGEWGSGGAHDRIQPAVVKSGSLEFARVLNHEANPTWPKLPPWIARRPHQRLFWDSPTTRPAGNSATSTIRSTPEPRPWSVPGEEALANAAAASIWPSPCWRANAPRGAERQSAENGHSKELGVHDQHPLQQAVELQQLFVAELPGGWLRRSASPGTPGPGLAPAPAAGRQLIVTGEQFRPRRVGQTNGLDRLPSASWRRAFAIGEAGRHSDQTAALG